MLRQRGETRMIKGTKKVIVLGGGLTGLSAAYRLSQQGVSVTVIEERPRLGGIAASIKYGKYIFDYGPHRFHTKNLSQLEEIKTLMQDKLNILYRKSSIRLMGKYFVCPLEIKNLLLNMGPLKSTQAFLDYVFTITMNKLVTQPDSSFENWVVNRFGRTLYNIYFGPYTEKLWGIHPARISTDWASQRIALMNLWDVAIRLLIKKDDTPRTYETKFYYPYFGSGEFSDKFAEKIELNNGVIHTQAEVVALNWEGNSVDEVVFIRDGCESREKADYIISTIPITKLILMSKPLLQSTLVKSAMRLKYRGIVFLFLVTRKKELTDNHWIYCPEKELIFNRLSEPKNFSDKMVVNNTTSICIEISCNQGDHIWMASKDEIFKFAMDSLKRMDFMDESDVLDFFIDKLPDAYPIYELGYEDNIENLISFLHSSANLITAGRQGLFRYGNMDHAIDMGFLAAQYLLNGDGDKSRLFDIANKKDYFG